MAAENATWLLERVAGLTKREIEAVVSEVLAPDVSPQITMDFGERHPSAISLLGGNDDVEPALDTTPKRYAPEPTRAAVTSTWCLSPRVRAACEAYRAMVHQTGDAGDVDDLLVRALETATEPEEMRRFGAKRAATPETTPNAPRRSPVPKPARREVHHRDGVRCTFTLPDGVRCNTRRRLQRHHRVAFTHGGVNTTANFTPHCGPHNQYRATLDGLPRPSREGTSPRQ